MILGLLLLIRLENSSAIKHDDEVCGQQFVLAGLIAGGNKTVRGEWPWLVALELKPDGMFFCAGTLISEKHVLSGELCNFCRYFAFAILILIFHQLLIASNRRHRNYLLSQKM